MLSAIIEKHLTSLHQEAREHDIPDCELLAVLLQATAATSKALYGSKKTVRNLEKAGIKLSKHQKKRKNR